MYIVNNINVYHAFYVYLNTETITQIEDEVRESLASKYNCVALI